MGGVAGFSIALGRANARARKNRALVDELRFDLNALRSGRCRALRRLGVPEWMLRYVPTRRGAWFVARRAMMHTALSKRTLRRYGFVMPSDLAASS